MNVDMSEWVEVRIRANIDSGLTPYCFCGRRLKKHKDDDKNYYCRRHGLQAVIDRVERI